MLKYAPLLHILADVPGGDAVLKGVRTACVTATAAAISKALVAAAAPAEATAQIAADSRGMFFPPPPPSHFPDRRPTCEM
jgi:hypothetical protein